MIRYELLATNKINEVVKMMQDFYAIDNYHIDVAIAKKLFGDFIANENSGKCYLIYSEQEIVGYFILTFIFSFEYKGRLAFLDEIFIRDGARGQGIGQSAIEFIKVKARNLNIKMMYLEVENHNHLAQKLYLANGFELHNRKIMKHKC
ncbi:MAG: hypothetical protein RLZZ312_397 [Bacteroidota bacterium]|jgi:GNAT superfamily N-acetyltransferase